MNRASILKKRASEKIHSLISEGYILKVQCEQFGFYSLQHKSNGNWARITLGQLGVYTYINGKLKDLDIP